VAKKVKGGEPENRTEIRKKKPLPEAAKPFMFKPGQSGNPGGRPKKKPVTDAYARLMSNPAHADEMAKALYSQALAGNVQAARELREGIEGKAMQAIRMDGELGLTTMEERKQRMVELLRKAASRIEGAPIQ
jgi:hypothetical protein